MMVGAMKNLSYFQLVPILKDIIFYAHKFETSNDLPASLQAKKWDFRNS